LTQKICKCFSHKDKLQFFSPSGDIRSNNWVHTPRHKKEYKEAWSSTGLRKNQWSWILNT
jgi:hypothetical protein